jgi:hypothetical protein
MTHHVDYCCHCYTTSGGSEIPRRLAFLNHSPTGQHRSDVILTITKLNDNSNNNWDDDYNNDNNNNNNSTNNNNNNTTNQNNSRGSLGFYTRLFCQCRTLASAAARVLLLWGSSSKGIVACRYRSPAGRAWLIEGCLCMALCL